MTFVRSTVAVVALLISATLLLADNQHAPATREITEETRMNLVRDLNAEIIYIRRPFPIGQKGLTIKDGKVVPGEEQVARMVAVYGPAVKPGDQARITDIKFKGKDIIFEINGGPVKKKKWYEHIQVSGMGGGVTPTDPTADTSRQNVRGTFVVLAFDKYVPELTTEEVKQMLRPVFDFNAKSAAEAFIDTLPPKVKDAIKNHQVLVGMNREMVEYALGRPPKKYRDSDEGKPYEEWIYGEPPKEVKFVRFVGDQVVRLEIMKVNGEKVVRTDREVAPPPTVASTVKDPVELSNSPGQRPTLRRPGEAAPDDGPLPKGGVDDDSGSKGPPPVIPGNAPPTQGPQLPGSGPPL